MRKILATDSNNFDFMRLSAAILVVFSHSYILGAGSQSGEPLIRATRGYLTGGDLAVDIFFVISGYLVSASLLRSKTTWAYLKKRIMRIYPGFIAATLVDLLLVRPLASAHLGGPTVLRKTASTVVEVFTLRDLNWLGALRFNAFPFVVNGSLWTIHYEFICYIFLAALGLFLADHLRRFCLSFFALFLMVRVGFAVYSLNYNQAAHSGPIANALRFLPLFFAGVVAYLYRDKVELRATWALLACSVLIALLRVPDGFSCAFPLAGSYLLLFFAYHPSIHLQHFARYGDFSYGTYLYAFPIQQLVVLRAGGHLQPSVLFLISAPLAVAAGALSWHLLERHFLSRSRLLQVSTCQSLWGALDPLDPRKPAVKTARQEVRSDSLQLRSLLPTRSGKKLN